MTTTDTCLVHPNHLSPRLAGALRWLAPLALGLAVQGAQAAQDAHVTPAQAYQLALEARTARDYPAMLSLLRQAAKADDLAAQELLGSLLLTGPALYGNAVAADPCEAAHWVQRAMASGSDVATHQRTLLNGLRDLPKGRDSCNMKMAAQ